MKIKPGMESVYKGFAEQCRTNFFGRQVLDFVVKWADEMERDMAEHVTCIYAPKEPSRYHIPTEGTADSIYECALAALMLMWDYGNLLQNSQNIQHFETGR